MELVELLEAEDVQKFNARRDDVARLELFAADLAEKNLVGVDLSRANCDKSDFTGADLSDSTLYGTSMTGIDGSGMKLVNAMAMKLRLKEAWMDNCDLSEADLSQANLKEANVEGSVGVGVILSNAKLRELNAKNVNWQDCEMVEATAHKADFTNSDLSRADLTALNGGDMIFNGAKLDSVIANQARMSGTQFQGASLVGARFVGANLQNVDFTDADLSNADLTGANLSGALFQGAILRGAVLVDACLDNVMLVDIDLTDVDLQGVDPTPLLLSDEQLAQVAAIGVEAPLDASILIRSPVVARNGKSVAVVWENPDSETEKSIRYVVFDGKKAAVAGVVPISAERTMSRALIGRGDGFDLVALRERPGGVGLSAYHMSTDGNLMGGMSTSLGYDPQVWPVLTVDDQGINLWGMARRGPTVVLHRESPTGLAAVGSWKVPTARGFMGRHHVVLACKGDVLMVAGPRGSGQPRRTPAGFPGKRGTAVPVPNERVFCVWDTPRRGQMGPGGLRFAWLESRGNPNGETLSLVADVLSLDGLLDGDQVVVAWIESNGKTGQAWMCRLPGGNPEQLGDVDVDARSVWLARDATGVSAVVVDAFGGMAVVEGKSVRRYPVN
ncbi:MAG: hypothetical protein GWP91_25020 [Rhodobacterales bacterium]|nr:hypothetical protein [Rhodobacterales bacterium]